MPACIHPAPRMPMKHQRPVKFYTAEVVLPDDLHVITFEAESFVMAAGFAALAAKEMGGELIGMDQHQDESARDYFLREVI